MVNVAFVQLGILIAVVLGVSAFLRFLKQPLIIGYILAGIVAGSYFLNIIPQSGILSSFGDIGVAILLFIVGLSLDLKGLKNVGVVSLIIGMLQVVVTGVLGFALLKLLGFSTLTSLYVGIALTFSSTIVISKLLSDKGSIDTFYGKIAVVVLVVQDLIVVGLLLVISALGDNSVSVAVSHLNLVVGFGLVILTLVMGVYALPYITKKIADSQEFLLLFSIAWCLVLSGLFVILGFSLEIGALLAGFALSFTSYRYEIGSRLKPLRDFFIVIFFAILGSELVFDKVTTYLLPIIILTVFVMVVKPFIMVVIMTRLGYSGRAALLAGLPFAQLSEFSLIFLALAVKVGGVSQEVLSVITVVSLVTFASSAYMIMYDKHVYRSLSKFVKQFEKKGKKRDEYADALNASTMLLGHDRIGFSLMKSLKKLNEKYVVIDFNPEIVDELRSKKVPVMYGDVEDVEFLDEIKIHKARLIVSTIPYVEPNLVVLERVRKKSSRVVVIMTANNVFDALKLYEKGADYVLLPHVISGNHAAVLIEKFQGKRSLYQEARKHQLKSLKEHIIERHGAHKVKKFKILHNL